MNDPSRTLPHTPNGSAPRRLHVYTPDCPVDLHTVYDAEPRLTVAWRGVPWVLPLAPLLPPGARDVRIRVERTPFRAPSGLLAALAAPIAALQAHPGRHDGTLTALLQIESLPAGGHVGRVGPVSYFCTRAIESLLDGPGDLRSADQPEPGCLARPRDSLLACDIGVVVILHTSDGSLVAQRRGPHLDWRAGHLSVSASGSLEPDRDFDCEEIGLDGLLAGARRELAEELGVGGPLDPHRAELQLRSLGIWRELQRGGKPELYSLARTPLTFAEVCDLHALAPDAGESQALLALDGAACGRVLDEVVRGGGALHRPGGAFGPIDLALVAALLLGAQPPG